MKRIGRKFTDRLIILLAFVIILLTILLTFYVSVCIQMTRRLVDKPNNVPSCPYKADFKKYVKTFLVVLNDSSNAIIFLSFFFHCLRDVERPEIITDDRLIESAIVGCIDTFPDIHDAIDKLQDELFGDSTSISHINPSPNPTLGELLHMKIT